MADVWAEWTPAVERRKVETLERADGTAINFELRAMSLRDIIDRDAAIPLPRDPQRGDSDTDRSWGDRLALHKEKVLQAQFSRWTWMLDHCWQAIPGADHASKEAWVSDNMTEALLAEVLAKILSLSGRDCLLVDRTTQSPVAATPDSLKALNERRMSVQIKRDGADPIALQVKVLSRASLNAIDRLCTKPEPPEIITRFGGRAQSKPNYEDPDWKKACAVKADEERVRLMEEAVAPLPGKDYAEKAAWLSARPAMEVEELILLLAAGGGYRNMASFF